MTEHSDIRTGPLSFSEWNGLWKSLPEEDSIGREEYEEVSIQLDHFCRNTYRESPQFPKDFYVRGDYTGDRTQVLEINNSKILALEFLKAIQGWLLTWNHDNWRILIPTYLSDEEVIIVYPTIIRISRKYESSLEDSIRDITSRMQQY